MTLVPTTARSRESSDVPRVRTNRTAHIWPIVVEDYPLHPTLPVTMTIIGHIGGMKNSHSLITNVHEIAMSRAERSLVMVCILQ